ncbi:MAG: ABC transporter ATP-binding protein [Firmicutes bacterium]|nr:ABC transporter ATP-binding protein [Bacillota bacterium]
MGLLEVQNLSYKYGRGAYVLKEINLSFQAGKVYVLLGESGAGKTTLLSLLAGLDVCSGGCISYNGRDIKTLNRDNYRATQVGMVFQQFNLLHRFNAVDNVLIAMEISRYKITKPRQYAEKQLEDLGINAVMRRRKVVELSGGEQQRVAIARALSHQPTVVLADEPTGSLDNDNRRSIMNSLTKAAGRDNRCVIISTHSKTVAEYADEVILLNKPLVTQTTP